MSTIELGVANFQDAIETNHAVLVDFWASWCASCREFAPIYEEAAAANPDLVFASVNGGNERLLAGALEIRSVPTLMAFKAGSVVYEARVALDANRLAEAIAKASGFPATHPFHVRTNTGGTP